MTVIAASECPMCGSPLVGPVEGQPWCPDCEWNLGAYDAVQRPPRGWYWIEKVGHRMAFRSDEALFAEYSGALDPIVPGWSRPRVLLVGISVLMFAAWVLSLVLGWWLLAHPSRVRTVPVGLALIALGVLLRPRFGRAPRAKTAMRREQIPELFDLVDRVAGALNAPPPDMIILNLGFNASVSHRGLRRKTVLEIGVGLWLLLQPQQRVALLAHELGHLVNGDPTRGLVVQPAMRTFGLLAEWTGADRTLGHVLHPERGRHSLLQLVFELVMWIISRVFLFIHLGLLAIGLRDHQRAEYLADGMSARVAGTEATVGLLDGLLCSADVFRLLGYSAERRGPDQWRGLRGCRFVALSTWVCLLTEDPPSGPSGS